MKFVSIDTETTGLDFEKCSVLSIGALIEDTKKKASYDLLPKFNAIILQRELTGTPRALTMNKEIISMMGKYLEGTEEERRILRETSGYLFLEKDEVVPKFYEFLYLNGYGDTPNAPLINSKTKPITINSAGKNYARFDDRFLQSLPRWQQLIRVRHRIIDPAILVCDWDNDEVLPSLPECKKRLNIEGGVEHVALDDAWDVIQVLRRYY